MTKDEALRLALEALEKTQSSLAQCFGSHKSEEGDRHRALAYSRITISAIKAALANEALERKAENARELGLDYEPCCYGGIAHDCHAGSGCKIAERLKTTLQAKDEPEYYGLIKDHLWMSISKEHYDRLKPEVRMACYTTPPKRTWVGLTDEEVWECYSGQGSVFYRAIEAKLKEKNT